MDFVYICRAGANEELRYSLRSVEKFFPEANVWVIGDKPHWYSGNHIPTIDRLSKYENIRLNILVAAEHPDISDDFVLMNDDFFILQSMEEIPIMHGESLQDKIDRYVAVSPVNGYNKLLRNTLKFLKSNKLPILDFDLHVPMVMNKELLKPIAKIEKICTRSAYGNTYRLSGIVIKDVKVYSSTTLSPLSADINVNKYFVSSEDGSFDKLYKELLADMFPHPSRFECPQ